MPLNEFVIHKTPQERERERERERGREKGGRKQEGSEPMRPSRTSRGW